MAKVDPEKDNVFKLGINLINTLLGPAALMLISWVGANLIDMRSEVMSLRSDVAQVKVHIEQGLERGLSEHDRRISHLELTVYDTKR